MEENFIIQTIISNIKSENKILYNLHIKNDYTLKSLTGLVEIIEKDNFQNETHRNEDQYIDTGIKQSEINELVEKIENLTLMIKDDNNIKENRIARVKCKRFGNIGHISDNCYANINNNFNQTRKNHKFNTYHNNLNNSDNLKYENKIFKLEKIFKYSLDIPLEEFKKLIKNPTSELEKLFEAFPNKYNTIATLKKNSHFMNQVFKSVHIDKAYK